MKVLFIGSKQMGYHILKLMYLINPEFIVGVITLDDRLDGRSRFHEMKLFCSNNDINFYIANNKKHSEIIIQSLRPDICFVINWYWLISKKILDFVPMGFLGIHNSLLPKYRGSSPLVWSIINGERYVGSSLFSFTEGMDEGKIWYQCRIELKFNHYIDDILKLIEKDMLQFFKESYLLILEGILKPHSQNSNEATYSSKRIPEDGKINFNKSSLQIYNFIRSQSFPYPGAFINYKGKKFIVPKSLLKDVTYYGTSGQVAKIDNEGVWIICGDSKAIVLKGMDYNIKILLKDRF